MAVAFDAKTAAWKSVNGVATMDVTNLTVGSGSNRALLVHILWANGSNVPGVSVVWDPTGANQACTLVPGTQFSTGALTASSSIYGLIAPTSGNKTLRISWTGNLEAHACAIALTGVDQTSVAVAFPHGATHFVSGASPATVTITSATGNIVSACHANNFAVFGATNGTLIAADPVGPNLAITANYANGAGPSVALTAAFTGSGNNLSAGCDILAAGGGAPTGTLAVTEPADTAAVSGSVTLTPATGTLAASETADAARFFEPLVTGTLATSEAADAVAFAGGSGGTPTLVHLRGSTTNDNNGNVAGNAYTFYAVNPTLAGNCLLLALAYPYKSGRTISIVDSTGDTWPAAAITTGTAALGNINTGIFVLPNASAGLHKLTVTFDAAVRPFQYVLAEFYNVATVSPVDGTHGAASVAGTAANAGSFTPTTNNDASGGHLIFSYAFSNDTVGTNVANEASAMSATNSAKLLHADNSSTIPSVSAYSVQTTNGAINPGFAITQATGTNFVVSAVALKAGLAGQAPAAGIRVVRLLHCTCPTPQTGNNKFLFPSDGNLLVATMASGDDLNPVNSVTDSNGQTYTARSAASQSQIFDKVNASSSNALALTLNLPATSQQFSIKLFDIIGAAASPFLNASGIYTAAPGTGSVVNDLPAHTPSSAPGLTIAQTGFGTGPTNGLAAGAPAGAVYDLVYYTNMTDQDRMDNADGFGHVNYTTTAAQHWNWGIDPAARGSTAFATAASYKEAVTSVTGTLAASEAADAAAITAGIVGTGTLAASEAADTAAASGNVAWLATLGATETADAAAITAGIVATGALSVSEAADAAAFAGGVVGTGILAASEAADAISFAGGIVASGTLAASEAADVAVISGGIVGLGIGAVLAAVEAADTAALVGQVTGALATLAATEAADAAAIAGGVVGTGILAASETADTAALSATSRWVAVLATSEASDAASFASVTRWLATLAASEARDTALFVSQGTSTGRITQKYSVDAVRTPPLELIGQRAAPLTLDARA